MHRIAVSCLVIAASLIPAQAATVYAVSTTNAFLTFDTGTPGTIVSSVAITGLQAGETVLGIDSRPATGQVYGLGSTSRLYTINTTTGAVSQVGSAGAFTLSGTAFGFDFNPTADRIRVTSTSGQNLRLNPNDGTLAATDTPLAYAAGDPNAGATPRVVGAAYSNNFAGALTTTLYGIDSSLDILLSQNPPNNGVLNTIGPLGFNTSDLTGFDIQSGTNTAFAAMTSPTGGASQLFTINLTTGAATLLGTIGTGVSISDITLGVSPVPEPGTSALLLTGLCLIGTVGRRWLR